MRFITSVFIFCFSLCAFAQNKKIDSLLAETKKSIHDTTKALIYLKIANYYSKNNDFVNTDIYCAKAKALTFLNYKSYYSKVLRGVAGSLKRRTKFQSAIDTLRKLIKFDQENNLEKELSLAYTDIGVIYRITGNFKLSIENLLKSIPIREKIGNKEDVMGGYNSLANSYSALAERSKSINDFEKAIEYYKKARANAENNPRLNAMILSNLGLTNSYIGKIKNDSNIFSLARNYHLKSYEIQMQLKDSFEIINILGNLGVINFDLGNRYGSLHYLNSAEKYFLKSIALQKALKLNDQYNSVANLAGAYLLMAKINHSKEDLQKGIRLSEEVLALTKKSGDLIVQSNMLDNLMNAYDISGDYKMALFYSKASATIKDTILNSENNSTIRELSAKFETDKKETENQLLKQQGELNTTQLKQQKIVSYSLILGALFLVVFIAMVYRNLNLSKKSNKIIIQQKLEVEKQKHLVEEKQKEVLDSINYAKRLQDAILPQVNSIKNSFAKLNAEVFVMYQPKDIVAGDFYFFEENSDHLFIAAADCTGHGVPGAMVSVVCSNALTRSVKEFNLTDPGKILDKTRELVLDTFSRSIGQVKDGMDISFLSIHKKNKTVSWAGANNALWFINSPFEKGGGRTPGDSETNNKQPELLEIKPNKQPIGLSDNPQPFITNTLPFANGTVLYLITDGFADQFGGTAGKKLKSKNFKTFLKSIDNLAVEEQQKILSEKFNNWKGNFEQVDDVCVIGIKLN